MRFSSNCLRFFALFGGEFFFFLLLLLPLLFFCDFPGGDARTLYRSIRKLLDTLPGETRIFVCHDYGAAADRDPRAQTSVAEEREANIHVRDGVSEDEFVQMREARDATLGLPRLMLPSVQMNVRGGQPPEPDESGVRRITIPLDYF